MTLICALFLPLIIVVVFDEHLLGAAGLVLSLIGGHKRAHHQRLLVLLVWIEISCLIYLMLLLLVRATSNAVRL